MSLGKNMVLVFIGRERRRSKMWQLRNFKESCWVWRRVSYFDSL